MKRLFLAIPVLACASSAFAGEVVEPVENVSGLLHEIIVLLEALLCVGCLTFGSLLFVHFGRFMRW